MTGRARVIRLWHIEPDFDHIGRDMAGMQIIIVYVSYKMTDGYVRYYTLHNMADGYVRHYILYADPIV